MIPNIISHISPIHGSLNVPIEHHPTIRYMVYNGYYEVMSNIPKMDQNGTITNPHSETLGRSLSVETPLATWMACGRSGLLDNVLKGADLEPPVVAGEA